MFSNSFCVYILHCDGTLCVNQEEEINEDDEKLFESFFVKDAPRQRTLADIIIKKIKDNDAALAEGWFIHYLLLCLLLFFF